MRPDDKDKIIITMLSEDPIVSQDEMAERAGLSQPSVAARVKKLREAGALDTLVGINPFRLSLQVAKVDVTTTNPSKVLTLFNECPYFLNGMIVSGKSNLTLFFAAERISTLEAIVDNHLRNLPDVTDVDFNMVIFPAKKMVMPVKLSWGKKEKCSHQVRGACKSCEARRSEMCGGCPITGSEDGWFF